jgi:hypothetical protein
MFRRNTLLDEFFPTSKRQGSKRCVVMGGGILLHVQRMEHVLLSPLGTDVVIFRSSIFAIRELDVDGIGNILSISEQKEDLKFG